MCWGQKRLDAKIAQKRAERAARAASHEAETEVEEAARDSTFRSSRAAVSAAPGPSAAQPCFTSITAEFVQIAPIDVLSSVFLENVSFDAEVGLVTRDTKQVDIADSAPGVLVRQEDDSEDKATAGSRRIVEAVFAESMARLPAHMRMIDYPPSLQQWYLNNKKPDGSDESPRGKRERPILQSRPWGN